MNAEINQLVRGAEVVDRADRVEREVRRSGRRLARRPGNERREIDELKNAVAQLSEKVERLVEARKAGQHAPDTEN